MRFLLALALMAAAISAAPAIESRATSAQGQPIKIRLNPVGIAPMDEDDYSLWTVAAAQTSSTAIGGVTLTLSVPDGSQLKGSRYKQVFTTFLASLGERIVGEGISTDTTTGQPVTLKIQGLAPGNHTLLTFHNAWDKIDTAATLSIAVEEKSVLTGIQQTIRQDSIWNSATSYLNFSVTSTSQSVTVVYTPTGGDGRAFLNGIELDTPNILTQISYPEPRHKEEHVDTESSTSWTATWTAPKSAPSPKYNVYFGTSNASMSIIRTNQTPTSITFTGLNTNDFYYWRVDVVSNDQVYPGRIFFFRLAHIAFPGAEGYGRFARGGRGGKVVKVTSLADSTEPGTLRYALTVTTGPRTVVFEVGGVITLLDRLTVNSPYLTIAGQTAPGKGVAIIGWPFGLSGARDVIVRHMRVRPGKVSNQTVDGMGMQGSNHCIFDRNSMGWSIDESFSSRSAYNITFQRNMISEPLNVAGHKNYPEGQAHGFAASISGDIGSFHHNLIAHAEGRSWSMAGGVDANGAFAGRLDMRNNVVYNWGSRVTDGGVHQGVFENNYYKPGPASGPHYDLRAQYENQLPGEQTYHCNGNSMEGYFSQDSKPQYLEDGGTVNSVIACWADVTVHDPTPSYRRFYDQPFFPSLVDTQTSTEAYKRVLSDSGAYAPVKDDHDIRVLNETVHGTYTYSGSVSGKPGLIDSEADVGGLESFPMTVRSASWDANGDGIADWWDGSTNGDGYTALEGYLNFMADPHAFVSPEKTVVVPLGWLAAGFNNPVFTVGGTKLGSVSVEGSTATYAAGSTTGIDYISLGIRDSDGSTWSRNIGVAVFDTSLYV